MRMTKAVLRDYLNSDPGQNQKEFFKIPDKPEAVNSKF